MSTAGGLCAGAALIGSMLFTAGPVSAAASTGGHPAGPAGFYQYTGARPLAAYTPGAVLKTRVLSYHVAGIPTPVTAVQLVYRSVGELGQPTTNVTSILVPPIPGSSPKVISYQSFYDSLNPQDEPSVAIAGGSGLGGLIANFESLLIAPSLLAGYTVVVPDTEGQQADFAAGPVYGLNTLYSLRAALSSPATGLTGGSPIGLIGYSGGAIATEWAAELAPKDAPDVNSHLVGAAMGGVLVDPDHNLHYVNGSSDWAGVMPMALIGVARAYHVDLKPYMSAYGQQLFAKLQKASITQVIGAYPGLTWSQIAAPSYPEPEDIPLFVKLANKLIMGTGGTPTVPLLIGQGANGQLEGTPPGPPGIGPGDGVMVTGDVRALALEYCQRGVTVQYNEYDLLSHVTSAPVWIAQAVPWLMDRFSGGSAPQDCSQIQPGNSLAPIR